MQKNQSFLLFKKFKIFDRDGSGSISANELKQAVTSLGEVLTDEEVNEMMRESDLNSDGKLKQRFHEEKTKQTNLKPTLLYLLYFRIFNK